mmetsp:Transcript_53222/g.130432  ORF Transcript_53222/g.130432 Transcript_53222/m.130432 type:complete len:166 (+) Transcript_53222:44-541(+)
MAFAATLTPRGLVGVTRLPTTSLRSPQRARRSIAARVANENTTEDREKAPPTQKSQKDTAKELLTVYGPAYLGTSMISSLVSIPVWYVLVSVGVDVQSGLNSLGDFLATTPVGRPEILSNLSPELGTFALAYIAHKASSPLRFPLVVAATPWVAGKVKALRGQQQ